jgi:Domain of unknown function (DUF222)
MGWRPGEGSGTGDEPDPCSDRPGRGIPDPPPLGRNAHLSGFARDGQWDACPPSAVLAAALEAVSGPGQRCPGASRDEMFGLLRQWQALESWAAAGKLGLLRALIRDDAQPLPGGGYHGDLPDGWTKSLTHEVALALSMPAVSADKLMWLAWNLQALLPGTGALLAGGDLTLAKARAVDQALNLLTGQDAARAEAMIVPDLPGKTYGQVQKLAVQAAVTVDPESATRRREDAEQRKSRVEMFREESGAAALSGRDLPTDQTLAAHASVCARAQDYKDSGAFPDETRMDQYRAAAYLDLLNGVTTEARIATGYLVTITCADTTDMSGNHRPAPDIDDPDEAPDDGEPGGDDPHDGSPGGGAGNAGPGAGPDAGSDAGPGGGSPDRGSPGSPDASSSEPDLPPGLADLVLPLTTLLGLAQRPGEGYGLGPLDPALCRELAAAAVGSPWTRLCVTVTDPDGIAIGHGCAKPARRRKQKSETASQEPPEEQPASFSPPRGSRPTLALPARVNLTITAARMAQLSGTGPPWYLTRTDTPGPPGGYGTWTLTLPDGRQLTVHLEPVPTRECDHRHESHSYQPNDTLRHLVQVRDGDCTFPPCSRPARESDYEHAIPYDKGGRTCACNAGARSRACHQVKQSPGWKVAQPRPGWHRWQTPAGRVYTQGPKRYLT